jgi:hypothetical protein
MSGLHRPSHPRNRDPQRPLSRRNLEFKKDGSSSPYMLRNESVRCVADPSIANPYPCREAVPHKRRLASPLALRGGCRIRKPHGNTKAYSLDPGARQTHSSDKRTSFFGICLPSLSSASASNSQSMFGTTHRFLPWAAGGFSNNSELQRIEKGKGFVSEYWCIIIRLVSASSTQLSVGKFSPEGHSICSFACALPNPIDSLFPSSTVRHHSCYSLQRTQASAFSLR